MHNHYTLKDVRRVLGLHLFTQIVAGLIHFRLQFN